MKKQYICQTGNSGKNSFSFWHDVNERNITIIFHREKQDLFGRIKKGLRLIFIGEESEEIKLNTFHTINLLDRFKRLTWRGKE